jgi:hypothetical protein
VGPSPLFASACHEGSDLLLVAFDLDPKAIVGLNHAQLINDLFHSFTSCSLYA